jgi:hypothetical protein
MQMLPHDELRFPNIVKYITLQLQTGWVTFCATLLVVDFLLNNQGSNNYVSIPPHVCRRSMMSHSVAVSNPTPCCTPDTTDPAIWRWKTN